LTLYGGAAARAEAGQGWRAPFGGTLTGGLTLTTDYSYRGISQTRRQPAIQPSITYQSSTFASNLPLRAYGTIWASNVRFDAANAFAEVDFTTGLRMNITDTIKADLSFTRVVYPGAAASLSLDYNEWQLQVAYDFRFAQLLGVVRYAPNFYANSGIAWDKWGSLTVPLPFLHVADNVTFSAYAALGNEYIERNLSYGLPRHDYINWEFGGIIAFSGFSISLGYIGTNLSAADCGNTSDCAGRLIFSVSKSLP